MFTLFYVKHETAIRDLQFHVNAKLNLSFLALTRREKGST